MTIRETADFGALAAVRRHYADATSTQYTTERLIAVLCEEYDIRPDHILLADSICSDDVNSIEYPPAATQLLGPFKLGGLDGFPHAGVTGMGAFAAHVPDAGAVVIYHAPHIGVSRDGTLGMLQRKGQHAPSGCCGAARAALARLQAGSIVRADPDALDYQRGTIEQILLGASGRILAAAEPLKEATEVVYEAIAERIDLLIARTRFPCRWVVRYGGILINGDADMGSFSSARRVTLTDLQDGSVRDLKTLVSG